MPNKLKISNIGRGIGMVRGLGWMNLVNPNIRRGFIIKTLSWGTRIGFPTKILKDVVMLLRFPGVLVMGSNTWIGVLLVIMVA